MHLRRRFTFLTVTRARCAYLKAHRALKEPLPLRCPPTTCLTQSLGSRAYRDIEKEIDEKQKMSVLSHRRYTARTLPQSKQLACINRAKIARLRKCDQVSARKLRLHGEARQIRIDQARR